MAPVLGAALLLGVLLMSRDSTPKQPGASSNSSASRDAAIKLIREEAAKQGLPASIALAFAEAESGFDPLAEGDKQWPDKQPELYRKLVLEDPRRAANPARTQRELWHSYGLFQLLAPYHARPKEDPRVLLEPRLNAQRGIAFIKSLLAKHRDDLVEARLAYAGALNVSRAEQNRVLERFAKIYQRWSEQEGAA